MSVDRCQTTITGARTATEGMRRERPRSQPACCSVRRVRHNFVRGKDVTIEKDNVFTAFVDHDVLVQATKKGCGR
jgi:hypothetical protein